jgi:hypothetical protein
VIQGVLDTHFGYKAKVGNKVIRPKLLWLDVVEDNSYVNAAGKCSMDLPQRGIREMADNLW